MTTLSTITNKDFFFSGNATFTVHNDKGEHFTYKAVRKGDSPVFLKVMTGPDNTNSFTYAGILAQNGRVITTKGSRISGDAKSVKVASWAIKKVLEGKELPEGYNVHHDGTCGRCGRKLTTPESVAIGLGPICMGK